MSWVVFPPDVSVIKNARKPGGLKKGLDILAALWHRGCLPKDLAAHRYCVLFAYNNGNVLGISRMSGEHRNSLIVHFKKLFRKRSTIWARKIWRGIQGKNPQMGFWKLSGVFRGKMGDKLRLSPSEHRRLGNLWLLGMPLRALRAHYVLWAIRVGKSKKELAARLGKSGRVVVRYRAEASKKNSPASKWLARMKPGVRDHFPRRRGPGK